MGFSADDSVGDFLSLVGNAWPDQMVERIPILSSIVIPTLSNGRDTIRWIGRNDAIMGFSIRDAWKTLQSVTDEKSWAKLVWHKAYIPKHAVCVWLACWKRLPTQDRILMWKHDPPDLKCLLCRQTVETHDHLFFQCSYSQECLELLEHEVYLDLNADPWHIILNRIDMGNFKHWSTLQKLAFSALIYSIWRERNQRLFENRFRRPAELFKMTRDIILTRMAWRRRKKLTISLHGAT